MTSLLHKPLAVHHLVKLQTNETYYMAVLVHWVYFTFDDHHTFALKQCAPVFLRFLQVMRSRSLHADREISFMFMFISAAREAVRSHDHQDRFASLGAGLGGSA